MVKTKSALVAALDEQKATADGEAKERVSLMGKFRNLEDTSDGLRENYDIAGSQGKWPGSWTRPLKTPTCGDRSMRWTAWPRLKSKRCPR